MRASYVTRMSDDEFIRRAIIRALKRDIPNGGDAWGSFIARIAREIENGNIIITKKDGIHLMK